MVVNSWAIGRSCDEATKACCSLRAAGNALGRARLAPGLDVAHMRLGLRRSRFAVGGRTRLRRMVMTRLRRRGRRSLGGLPGHSQQQCPGQKGAYRCHFDGLLPVHFPVLQRISYRRSRQITLIKTLSESLVARVLSTPFKPRIGTQSNTPRRHIGRVRADGFSWVKPTSQVTHFAAPRHAHLV